MNKQKTEQKPKLDFTSESGIIAAAEILQEKEDEEEFHGLHVKDISDYTIILHAGRKLAMKVFEFAISQDWPVKSLSLIWQHRDKKVRPAFWKLDFHERSV